MTKFFIILTLILAILVIGSMLLISLLNYKKVSPQPPPVIKASFAPSSKPNASIKTLKLIAITPSEDISRVFLPIKQISLTFSEPMDPTTFFVKTSPSVETIITTQAKNNPNVIVITPPKTWQPGITTITVLPTTTSLSGAKLGQPIIYKINAQFPENPPPDSPGL